MGTTARTNTNGRSNGKHRISADMLRSIPSVTRPRVTVEDEDYEDEVSYTETFPSVVARAGGKGGTKVVVTLSESSCSRGTDSRYFSIIAEDANGEIIGALEEITDIAAIFAVAAALEQAIRRAQVRGILPHVS